MTRPLVSIIIDNYNYARFLNEAIESALSQAYANTEVIVVDDGSTDHSREVIEAFGDQIVSVFKENGGQASAFNAGFARSRGEIVMFLDSDDLLYPNAAARVAEAYEARADGYTKFQFRLRLCDQQSLPLADTHPLQKEEMPNGDVSQTLLLTGKYTSPPTSGNAFARSFLGDIMPMPEAPYRSGADGGYLVPLAALHGNIYSIDEELGMYRIHGNNGFFLHTSTVSTINKKWFARNVTRDILKSSLLLENAKALGLPAQGDPTLRSAYSMTNRLASLRLNGRQHPAPSDTVWGLLFKCLRAEWRYADESVVKKLLVSLWFFVVAFSPVQVVQDIIPWRFIHNSRPKFYSKLLQLPERLASFRGAKSKSKLRQVHEHE